MVDRKFWHEICSLLEVQRYNVLVCFISGWFYLIWVANDSQVIKGYCLPLTQMIVYWILFSFSEGFPVICLLQLFAILLHFFYNSNSEPDLQLHFERFISLIYEFFSFLVSLCFLEYKGWGGVEMSPWAMPSQGNVQSNLPGIVFATFSFSLSCFSCCQQLLQVTCLVALP